MLLLKGLFFFPNRVFLLMSKISSWPRFLRKVCSDASSVLLSSTQGFKYFCVNRLLLQPLKLLFVVYGFAVVLRVLMLRFAVLGVTVQCFALRLFLSCQVSSICYLRPFESLAPAPRFVVLSPNSATCSVCSLQVLVRLLVICLLSARFLLCLAPSLYARRASVCCSCICCSCNVLGLMVYYIPSLHVCFFRYSVTCPPKCLVLVHPSPWRKSCSFLRLRSVSLFWCVPCNYSFCASC